MTSKLNCIKKGAKYIIGAAVLATSLSSAVFGLSKESWFGDGGYYQICNEKDLREFAELVNSGKETGAKGKLMNDIDLDCKNFGEWIPIGTDNSPFQGELISNDDDNNKKITGLYINEEYNDYQGLFGYIEEKGKLENIVIEGSIHGKDNIGGIAGYNKGTINNCYATIKIKENDNVGGNVGYNNGTIMKICCNKGGRIEGKYNVGGNVGYNKGIISGYCSNGAEFGGMMYVGGNVGWNEGAISGCCSNIGAVIGGPYKGCYIGGNVGWNKGEIESCENSGKIIANRGSEVGGNVGENEGTIKNCRNSGKVTGNNEIRRIVGLNKEEGEDNGAITGESHFGGNVGKNNGKIVTCENFGHVITENGEYVGGNIGYIGKDGSVNKCINKGFSRGIEIECQGKEYVGGNVGCNQGTIKEECSNSVYVYGIDNHVGGNVGQNEGTIKLCENNGKVITENGKYVGGNIGYIGEDGSVEKCINKGFFQETEVECQGKEYVGGNVGFNEGTIIKGEFDNSACVYGIEEYVGGNIGYNLGTISVSCINQGKIIGNEKVGGNIGYHFNNKSEIQCENKGNIEGKYFVGGNIGANYGAEKIQCKNEGEVEGTIEGTVERQYFVGGNIGHNIGKIDDIANKGSVNGVSANIAKKIGVQY